MRRSSPPLPAEGLKAKSRPRIVPPDVPRSAVILILRKYPEDKQAAKVLGIPVESVRRLREVLS